MTQSQTFAGPTESGPDRIRALAPSELLFATAELYVGYASLCAGELDLTELNNSFAELQEQHPELRSVLRESDAGFEFVADSSPPARVRLFQGEDPHAQATGRGAVFDQTESLAYLDVLPGDDRTRVTLFVHHSAADGHHALDLLEELWDRYACRVETGEPRAVRPRPFPQSMEHYLATREHPGSGPVTADELPAELLGSLDQAPRRNVMLPLRARLSEAQTNALVDLGHKTGTTVNALVSAAIIKSHTRSGEAALGYSYVVDVRSRVIPAVGHTEATNMIPSATFSPDGGEDDLVVLARRIREQLVADLASGVIHTGAAQAEQSAAFFQGALSMATSTNWGRIPPLRTPPGLAIVDFQSFFPPNPLFDAILRLTGAAMTAYVITTFDGRLSVESMAGEVSDDLQEHLDRIATELRAVLRSHV